MIRLHHRPRKVRRRRLQHLHLRWVLLIALGLAVVGEYLPAPPQAPMLTTAETP